MGEAFHSEIMGNAINCPHQTTHNIKERRNGMGNIFEGIDPSVMEKLGLSEEMFQQNSEEDDTFTQCVAQLAEAMKSTGSLEKSRIHRSLSTTITEEMKLAFQNRRRRNAVGNLLELLSSSQQLLLVEHLQEELERTNIAASNDNDSTADSKPTDNSCETDLTASQPTCSVVQGSSVTLGHIVCH